MKSILKLTVMLLCCMAVESWAHGHHIVINSPEVPQDFPLRLANPKETDLGTVLDWETRPITLTVKNIADRTVTITNVITTCSCIVLTEPFKETKVAPKNAFSLRFHVLGSHLNPGPIDKEIALLLEDKTLAKVKYSGLRKDKVTLLPAKAMNLGTYRGQARWRRSFKIRSNFPNGKLKLLQPKPDNLFQYTLTQLNPQEYQVDFQPKSYPVPYGLHRKFIAIPTQGIENYGPILLPVRVNVIRHSFRLERRKLVLRPQMLDNSKPFRTSVRLTQKASRRGKATSAPETELTDGKEPREIIFLPVAKEENEQLNLQSGNIWDVFAKDLTFTSKSKYSDVKLSVLPQEDHAKLQLEFPPDFFTQNPHGRLHAYVEYQKKTINELYVIW